MGLASITKAKVLPGIANHSVVLTSVAIPATQPILIQRSFWLFCEADWEALKQRWGGSIGRIVTGDPSTTVEQVTRLVLTEARARIPWKIATVTKTSHPWINDRCKHAIERKCSASGSDAFVAANDFCSKVLLESTRSTQLACEANCRTFCEDPGSGGRSTGCCPIVHPKLHRYPLSETAAARGF
jgi:hypothetical protein